jgi:hypothetical protein
VGLNTPKGFRPGIVLAVALLIRLAWILFTNFTAEDAFITFRFAQQIGRGNGFVYNPGIPIYGTTTPLFTLLLAVWSFCFSPAGLILGARLLDVLASLASLLLLGALLARWRLPRWGQGLAVVFFMVSSKVLLMDLRGMEMPLVIALMLAAWYAASADRPIVAGALCGLLLWTRIDLLLWPLALAAAEFRPRRRNAAGLLAACFGVYLPWILFSLAYFGSAIPYTIIAKWYAFGIHALPPLQLAQRILVYLSPLDLSPFELVGTRWTLSLAAGALTIGLAAVGARRFGGEKTVAAAGIFAVLEFLRLVLSRAAFDFHYFYPLLWVTLILAVLGCVALVEWTRRKEWRFPAPVKYFPAVLLLAAVFVPGILNAVYLRSVQTYRNRDSLQAVGEWLQANTPVHSTVLAEPLGYIGFYSDRWMLDEVGLVTPAVVELKKEDFPLDGYFAYLQPDYYVLHCDDALRLTPALTHPDTPGSMDYILVKTFNPLNFNPATDDISGLPRGACYQIWQRGSPSSGSAGAAAAEYFNETGNPTGGNPVQPDLAFNYRRSFRREAPGMEIHPSSQSSKERPQ